LKILTIEMEHPFSAPGECGKTLCTMCIGVGQGIAVVLERV